MISWNGMSRSSDKPKRRTNFSDLDVLNEYDDDGTLSTFLPRENMDIGPEPDFGGDFDRLSKFLDKKPAAVAQASSLRSSSEPVRTDATPESLAALAAPPREYVPLYGTLNPAQYGGSAGYSAPSLTPGGGANNGVAMGWTDHPEYYGLGPEKSFFVPPDPTPPPSSTATLTQPPPNPTSPDTTILGPGQTNVLSDPEEERKRQLRIRMGYIT